MGVVHIPDPLRSGMLTMLWKRPESLTFIRFLFRRAHPFPLFLRTKRMPTLTKIALEKSKIKHAMLAAPAAQAAAAAAAAPSKAAAAAADSICYKSRASAPESSQSNPTTPQSTHT